jgi:hypothetical protein
LFAQGEDAKAIASLDSRLLTGSPEAAF